MCVEEKRNILKKTLTMHVDEDDRLFSEDDKFCYGMSDIQKENIC